MQEVKRFFYDTGHIFGGTALQCLIGFVTFPFIVKTLSLSQYGSYSLFISVAQVSLIFCSTWTNGALVRFGKEEIILSGNMRSTYWARLVFVSISLLLVPTILLSFKGMLCQVIGMSEDIIFLVVLFLVVHALRDQHISSLQPLGKISAYSHIPTIGRLFVLVLVYLFSQKFIGPTVNNLVLILVCSHVLVAGVGLYYMGFKNVIPPSLSKAQSKKYFAYAWPALFGGLGGHIVDWVDLYVIRGYLTLEAVGRYAIAYNIMNYFVTPFMLSGILLNLIITTWHVKQRVDLIKYYEKNLMPTAIFFWGLLVAMGTVIGYWLMCLILGERMIDLRMTLVILMWGVIFQGIIYSCTPIFSAYLMSKESQLISLVWGICNLMAGILLVPRLGIVGAAIGTTFCYAFFSFVYLLVANRRLEINSLPTIVCTIPGSLIFVVALLSKNLVFNLGMWMIISLVSYLILRKIRFMEAPDFRILDKIDMPESIQGIVTSLSRCIMFIDAKAGLR